MSTVIKRKVKKPTLIHRAKKVVNSQDKSLHRSMLSHSRIATGYKKKIAALLGNNRALAHALEMAHVELSNKDKIVGELQRRLALQSPKRFKGKIQKVCEHLQVIVALLQDILDDSDDFADANILSFSSQINNCSRRCSNHSESQQSANGNMESNSIGIDLTPLPNWKLQPQVTTAAEMSAILEHSALLEDENLPPILFPEDDDKAMPNITQRKKSKSRSASSQLMNRESKRYSESPQKRKSGDALNMDSAIDCEQRIDGDTLEIPLSPLPLHLFNSEPPSKENSAEKISPKSVNSKNVYISDSPRKFCSPRRKSSDGKMSVKRKSLSRKKNKKNRLIVKLPCTPRRSLERDNMKEESSKNNSDRRKTFTVKNSSKANRRTFVLSPKTEVPNSGLSKNSPELHNEVEVISSPPQLHREQDKNEGNSYSTFNNNPIGHEKKQCKLDNTKEMHNLDSATKDDITSTDVQDMELTCPALTAVLESDARKKEVIGTPNDVLKSSKYSNNLCSQLMYGYDPLEGTSKNKKFSISLNNRNKKSFKNKLPTKIPKIVERHPTVPSSLQHVSKDNRPTHTSISRTECVHVDTDILQTLVPKSQIEFHTSSPKQNLPDKNTRLETGDQSELLNGFSSEQHARTLSNHINNHIKEDQSNHAALHKPNEERSILQNKETTGDQEIFSVDGIQPVVRLDDIWTSIKSQPSSTECDNFIYVPDTLGRKVLKVETPNKTMSKIKTESANQNTKEDEVIDKPEMEENMSEKADSDDIPLGDRARKRRRTKPMSYKEPSLTKKLRQGDPFTSGFEMVKNLSKKENRKQRSCSVKKTYCEDGTSDSEKSDVCY